MSSHLHTIRKTPCSLWPGVISRADIRRRCLGSLINNNSSCLAVATGQGCWGDFDQSLSVSWECQRVHAVYSLTIFARGLSGLGWSERGWLGHSFSVFASILVWRLCFYSQVVKNKNISGFGWREKKMRFKPALYDFLANDHLRKKPVQPAVRVKHRH